MSSSEVTGYRDGSRNAEVITYLSTSTGPKVLRSYIHEHLLSIPKILGFAVSPTIYSHIITI